MAVADYLKPYIQAQGDHGPAFDVTLWANEKSQRLRFEIFAEMVDFTGLSILDAGCSRADFAAYLVERRVAYGHYLGVDGLCDVVDYARSRGLPRTDFRCGDVVSDAGLLAEGPPQITVISGTLNTMRLTTALRLLKAAWAGCTQALAFNFLPDTCDPKAPRQGPPARRLSTLKLLGWAFDQTWDVRYRQDYFPLGHDATVVMRKT